MSDPTIRLAAFSALALGLCAAVFAPTPVLAQDAAAPAAVPAATPAAPVPLVLTYAAFEAAVPHADLADCPASLAGADRFCRMTLNAEAITVWVFGLDGDQPLLATEPYDIEGLSIGF